MSKVSCKIKAKREWFNYLWVFSVLYLCMGFFNIMFAWVGLLCFFAPLIISVTTGKKTYCSKYCGRGQLFALLGKKARLSRNMKTPSLLKSNFFRYAFLAFFLTMFVVMLFNTYMVAKGASLSAVVTLLWTFKLPWQWAGDVSAWAPWAAQFAYGFYGVMLSSTILGIISMLLFKPRSWCAYCPMGTMTQIICKIKGA